MKNVSAYSNVKNISTIGNTQTGHHYWVGRVSKEKDFFAGQTFRANKTGTLKSISIFSEIIIRDTEATLSVFEFDSVKREWKEKVAEAIVAINKSMEKQWVSFELENANLDSNKHYAFKVSCANEGMMAIAESHWREKNLYKDGAQWTGSSENPAGLFHQNFDLSFIAAIENN
ncbi:MAG: hypothetical protein ABI861_04930 [Panacibacter sp.]